MAYLYYNEPQDELAGSARLLGWTGLDSPDSALLSSLGIHQIFVPPEWENLPLSVKKENETYIAVPVGASASPSSPRQGYLSNSDKGKGIVITQSSGKGQLVHRASSDQKLLLTVANPVSEDIILSIRIGSEGEAVSQKIRAGSNLSPLPSFYLGEGVEVFLLSDTPGLVIFGGWES